MHERHVNVVARRFSDRDDAVYSPPALSAGVASCIALPSAASVTGVVACVALLLTAAQCPGPSISSPSAVTPEVAHIATSRWVTMGADRPIIRRSRCHSPRSAGARCVTHIPSCARAALATSSYSMPCVRATCTRWRSTASNFRFLRTSQQRHHCATAGQASSTGKPARLRPPVITALRYTSLRARAGCRPMTSPSAYAPVRLATLAMRPAPSG